jgi:tetratricopeptide (TPR) repeat protein
MGLLDKLFGRTWRTFYDRANRYRDANEPGLALHEYREALKRLSSDAPDAASDRHTIEDAIRATRTTLCAQQLERARAFHQSGALDRARDACDSAEQHAQSPEQHAEIQSIRASLSLDLSDRARRQAEDHQTLSRADADVAMSPDDERFYILIAGLGDDVAAHYEGLDANFRQGFVALYDQEFNAAHRLLSAALERAPDDPLLQTELARALMGQNKPQDALSLLLRADASRPNTLYIKLRLVEAAWLLNDLPAAEAALQSAHDLDPNNDRVHVMIAEHCMRTRDYATGLEAVALLIARYPQDTSLIRLRGQIRQASGDLAGAVQDYEAVLKVRFRKNPDTGDLDIDPIAAAAAASIYIDGKQRLDRAIDLLHGLLSVTQGADSAQVYINIARAYELKDQPRLARETLQKALDLLPEHLQAARAALRQRLQSMRG